MRHVLVAAGVASHRVALHGLLLVAWAAVFVVALALAMPLRFYGRVVSKALASGPGERSRFEFACEGFDCEEMPRVTNVNCPTRFFLGACCVATLDSNLGSPMQTEVHVWLRGPGVYKLELTEPRVPTTLRGLDRL